MFLLRLHLYMILSIMDARRLSKPSIANCNEKPFSHNYPKIDGGMRDEPLDLDADVIDFEMNNIEPERPDWSMFRADNHPSASKV